MKKISVIVVNYNTKKYLANCLMSVLRSDYPEFEILFVDSGSTDGSTDFVRSAFGGDLRLKIIRSNINLFYPKASNLGASVAKGDILVFLNADTTVDSNWLTELARPMNEDSTIGACQPKSFSLEDKETLDSVGSYFTPFGFLFYPGFLEPDQTKFNNIADIFTVKGPCVMVRRDIFERIGGYDESFFMYFEEADLSWRIWLNGYRVVLVPSALIYHRGHFTRKQSRQAIKLGAYRGFRNRLMSLLKNLNQSNLLRIIPRHVILCVALSLFLLARRRILEGIYMLKGILAVLANLRTVLTIRKEVQTTVRHVSDDVFLPRLTINIGLRQFRDFLQNYLDATEQSSQTVNRTSR